MKGIAYSKDALRILGRIPAHTARLIRTKIEQYASEPAAQVNNVKPLKGEPGIYRLRVGDWRILFNEDGDVIAVIRSLRAGAPTIREAGP